MSSAKWFDSRRSRADRQTTSFRRAEHGAQSKEESPRGIVRRRWQRFSPRSKRPVRSRGTESKLRDCKRAARGPAGSRIRTGAEGSSGEGRGQGRGGGIRAGFGEGQSPRRGAPVVPNCRRGILTALSPASDIPAPVEELGGRLKESAHESRRATISRARGSRIALRSGVNNREASAVAGLVSANADGAVRFNPRCPRRQL